MRLIQGDCPEVMDQLIEQGVKVDAIITDPPYGKTACKWDSVIPLDEMWKRIKEIRKDNAPIILFGSEPFSSALRISNIKEYRYDWVWLKHYATGFMNANKMPMKSHEDILIFYKKLPTYNPQGIIEVNKKAHRSKQNDDTVYNDLNIKPGTYTQRFTNYPRDRIETGKMEKGLHPSQKPVDLMEYLILTYTNEGDTVLDFTMGSGTTGVACKNIGRHFIGIELDENYFNIAKQRIEGV